MTETEDGCKDELEEAEADTRMVVIQTILSEGQRLLFFEGILVEPGDAITQDWVINMPGQFIVSSLLEEVAKRQEIRRHDDDEEEGERETFAAL